MASSTETGHAKNIGNSFLLNQKLTGFGAEYNPSNLLIVLLTMIAQQDACNTLQLEVNAQNGIFKPLVNGRKIVFKDVKKLVRRIRSAVKSCGASAEFIADVDTIVSKILGERSTTVTATPADPAGTSASQQSMDNTTNNFFALVELLKNEPLYTPSKADLKIAALTIQYTAMDTSNKGVKVGATPYNLSVTNRNKALYTTTTGLLDVCQSAKDEVRSVFGFSSPEFKQVSAIQFRKLADVD